jgi:tetratricopeptide (TPR) repeat protein
LTLIENEAQIAESLDHPNIARVFESGMHGPHLYVAMAPIQGLSVETVLQKKGCFQFRTAAEVALEAAKALAFGHGRGIFHRNLKSSNVFLAPGGKVRVADFGLQRIPDPLDKVGRGTDYSHMPEFLCPEQAAGDFDRVDQRSDVYALGMLLYRMLTFQPPFANGRDTLIHYQILNNPPVPPRQREKSIPRALEAISLKAIQKKPHERYWSMAEMATDLNRFLSGEPVRAEEELRRATLLHKAMSSRLGMTVAFVLALGLAVAGGVLFRSLTVSDDSDGENPAESVKGPAAGKGSQAEKASLRKAKRAMKEALAFPLKRAQLPDRIAKLEEAVKHDTDLLEAHLHLGYALLLSGQDRIAVDSLSRGCRGKETAFSKYLWGLVYHEYHMNVAAARREFTKGAKLPPLGPYGLLCNAWVLWLSKTDEKDEGKEALEILDQADESNAYPWETGLLRGIIFHSPPEPKLPVARLSFSRSTEALGGYPPALVRRALAYIDERQFSYAARDLGEALEIDPSHAHARTTRGRLYHKVGKHKKALIDLKLAVATAPRYHLARILKGDILIALERYKEAAGELTKAIDLQPKDSSIYLKRGVAYCRSGQVVKAEADLRKAVELEPYSAENHFFLGDFLKGIGRTEQALKAFAEAIRLRPQGARYYFARAELHWHLERFIEAREDYEQTIIHDPTNDRAYHQAAYILAVIESNYEVAAEHIETGLQNCPDSPNRKEMEKFRDWIRDEMKKKKKK